ncbi:hypothetical protein BEL01nite_63960 [Bradyrhizobium elkanii]|nr:hypothetical protein BEL01nite_63960 [Bradyrhizobium elkanii]
MLQQAAMQRMSASNRGSSAAVHDRTVTLLRRDPAKIHTDKPRQMRRGKTLSSVAFVCTDLAGYLE